MIMVTCGQASVLIEACRIELQPARTDETEDRTLADIDVPEKDRDTLERRQHLRHDSQPIR